MKKTTKSTKSTRSIDLSKEWLSEFQRWYWRNPDKARALQRDKYKRYPEKIYAGNRAWQKKNKAHWNMLMKFAYAIRKAKLAGDKKAEQLARAAREEYKNTQKLKCHKAANIKV